MSDNKKQIHIMLLKALHLGFTLITFYIAWLMFRYGKLTGMNKYGFRYNYFVLMGYGVLLMGVIARGLARLCRAVWRGCKKALLK